MNNKIKNYGVAGCEGGCESGFVSHYMREDLFSIPKKIHDTYFIIAAINFIITS